MKITHLLFAFLLLSGCGPGDNHGDAGTDSESESEMESDTGSDADTDVDSCDPPNMCMTGPDCYAKAELLGLSVNWLYGLCDDEATGHVCCLLE